MQGRLSGVCGSARSFRVADRRKRENHSAVETGAAVVLRAGPEQEILSRRDLGERFIATPAISNGRVFLRSNGNLFAVGE